MGDCLEYFTSNSMFEIICAYTKADKPLGFFKIGIPVLIEIILGITCTSLLSQSNIHQGLVMLLNSINLSIQHESQYFNYEEEIVDLMTAISLKTYNEPFLVNIFFTNASKCSNKKTERGEYLPLKIVLMLFKKITNSNNDPISMVSSIQHEIYFTLKTIMRTNNKLLDEYIMNESDLIEIVMSKLNGLYHSLPQRVSKKKKLGLRLGSIKMKNKRRPNRHFDEEQGNQCLV